MLSKPCMKEEKEGSFIFGAHVKGVVSESLLKDIFREMWSHFCFGKSIMEMTETEKPLLWITNTENVGIQANDIALEGYDYLIDVTGESVMIYAKDDKALINGFFTLAEHITPVCLEEGKIELAIPCMHIKDKPSIEKRMVHLCVFPETTAEFIQRFIRLSAAVKFNYLVMEFWGTLQYNCLKELAWEGAFTKEQIKCFIALANDLGMEVIPMFNHWGHASESRACFGKHTVLDQNPGRQMLFDATGWAWNIRRKDVRELMYQIRHELMELCGEGSYFHIGCDEAYGYENDPEIADILLEYVREICDDLEQYGRRPIMWGDMLLHTRHQGQNGNVYYCDCHNDEMERILVNGLDKRVIIADWQYEAKNYPVTTSQFFKENGFDVICCPWDRSYENVHVCLETVKKEGLYGSMHTTWHTLHHGMPHLVYAGCLGWSEAYLPREKNYYIETAPLLRKAAPVKGDYQAAGWGDHQIGIGVE